MHNKEDYMVHLKKCKYERIITKLITSKVILMDLAWCISLFLLTYCRARVIVRMRIWCNESCSLHVRERVDSFCSSKCPGA